jgi:two-component system cell cycle response regulator
MTVPLTKNEGRLGTLRCVIVGPGAEAFAAVRRQRDEAASMAATTLVEAIILARLHGPIELFLINVAQEIADLTDAIAALRSVNPHGIIVALCDPWDEAACRRLVGRGIDDYLILPCTEAAIDAALGQLAQRRNGAAGYVGRNARTAIRALERSAADAGTRLMTKAAAASASRDLRERSAIVHAADLVESPAADSSAPQMIIGLPGVTVTSPKPTELDIQTDLHGAERVLVSAETQALYAATAAPQLGGAFDEETELERMIEAANRGDVLAVPSPGELTNKSLHAVLPMAVHETMLDSVLKVDGAVAATALTILRQYIGWPGKLEFTTPDATTVAASGAMGAISVPLERDGRRYGTLALHQADASWKALFDQAAQWFAGWLALAHRQEQLRNLAVTDELSGAYNRRYFLQFVGRLIDKARDGRFRITVLLFDIDDFKKYNDTFGHAAGDSIIRELIRLLRHCTRPHDVVARLGGDEFAVVFWDNEAPRQPNSEHPRSVLAATERFRVAVDNADWNTVSNIAGKVSISGGIASYPWDAKNIDDLLAVADGALLRAKKQGKNVIVLHEAEGAEKQGEAKRVGE